MKEAVLTEQNNFRNVMAKMNECCKDRLERRQRPYIYMFSCNTEMQSQNLSGQDEEVLQIMLESQILCKTRFFTTLLGYSFQLW